MKKGQFTPVRAGRRRGPAPAAQATRERAGRIPTGRVVKTGVQFVPGGIAKLRNPKAPPDPQFGPVNPYWVPDYTPVNPLLAIRTYPDPPLLALMGLTLAGLHDHNNKENQQ